jgi:signal transduction histidine kinase
MGRNLKKFFESVDIRKQAKELGLPIWQTPGYLFILMGVLIIAAMTGVYFISQRYDSPEVLVLSETSVVIVLFTIGSSIIRSVEEVAKANKMKSEFVSIASHQLKTPLAEINWEVELLLIKQGQGLNEKQKEIVNSIGKSNERMARLVNDLLDVARIEQRRFTLVKEKTNILELVERVVENHRILARANNVEIKISKPKELPEAYVDRRRTKVALENLLSNAIKYIKRKGLVRVSVVEKSGSIVICVEDNGIGIPRREQNKIFEKFFRSTNIARYQVAGTGLGLYIAKNIVEQGGGRIWFKSKEGEGTTFCFSIPLK